MWKMFQRWLFCAVVAGGLGVPASAAPEFRGIWVDAWGTGFLTASQAQKLIADCRAYNFNAVFVQMRRRGDAFYMPQAPNLEPRTTAIAAGYDALATLIQAAHTGTPRIEVHCWVTSNLIWSGANPPPQASHVFNRHPEYLMKNFAGEMFLAEGYYLDPGNPEAMLWNYEMARDIVSRYDIDGFHWDYIRYPQQDAGYNEVALERFQEEYNLAIRPSPSDSRFSNFRRRQVTDFLRWVNADLLEIKPGLVISAAVFGNRTDAYNNRFQDWAGWASEGLMDLVLPMNYSANNDVFNTRANDAIGRQGVRTIYMGQGAYLNTKENTVTQLQYARNRGFLGTLFYSYRTPNSGAVNQAATFSHLKANFQPTWEATPELPWKVSPTRGIVKGSVRSGSTPIYNATVVLETATEQRQRTGAHGSYAFFEAMPGTYAVTAGAPGHHSVTQLISYDAGEIIDLDFTLPVIGEIGPITIVRITSGEEGWLVEVQAMGGQAYTLLGSTDLATWEPITTVNAPDDLFTISVAPTEHQFFQVRRGL